ncbi:malonate decarboxylase holo-ACP synthase [Alteribacillus bidgolensis]|uniref:Phosphoribosyl-dephospho-CoA transferase n=1 Tax=Alteribacillus bidgolensis TaxID=930129 RepID=A0A1G8KHS6_9BACI|nr:malonate decarboxylase holo-ACP synthase [Alteribacillus bidgolensis]SDI42979.1 phosphoribosyl-dephospho-CoA transferase [Alteribacillus bidgolensis]
MEIKPHDLLQFTTKNDLRMEENPPEWAIDAIGHMPYVVVRRAPIVHNHIPVGIRGKERGHRLAAEIPLEKIKARCSPEFIVENRLWKHLKKERRLLPVLNALNSIQDVFQSYQLKWGITGSAGYELVTEVPAVSPSSDLDIIIRTDGITEKTARDLYKDLNYFTFRIDVHVEGAYGAFALSEYVNKMGKIMLRTKNGPFLAADPWKGE